MEFEGSLRFDRAGSGAGCSRPAEAGWYVAPQWAGQQRPQQARLDLFVERYEAAAGQAVSLCAIRLADGPTSITLADPAGHPFELCQKDGVGPVMTLFAVTIDAPDALALAHFYAGRPDPARGDQASRHQRSHRAR